MSTSEVDINLRSEREKKIVDQKCAYCAKKVVDFVLCTKCNESFHPSCITTAANNKNAQCKHIPCEKKCDETTAYEKVLTQNKLLDMENDFLKKLLQESQEAYRVLKEYNKLLTEKVGFLENKYVNKNNHSQDVPRKKNRNIKINTTSSEMVNTNAVKENDNLETDKQTQNTNNSILTTTVEKSDTTTSCASVTILDKHIANNVNINKERKGKQDLNEQDGFQEVIRKNRKRQKKVNVGSRIEVDESTFKSFKPNKGSKKIWLFISRVNESVQEQEIKNYISAKSDSEIDQISVMLLKTRSNQAGFKSFMVGVPLTLKEEVYKNEFWPVGISFARFNFMRGQHFLEPQPNSKSSTQTMMIKN